VFVGSIPTIASAHAAGAALPIAKLNVQASDAGERVDIDLREGGEVFVRVPPQKEGRLAARINGSRVVSTDGSVLATLRTGGYLTVRGFKKTMRLRGCALIDEVGTEYLLTPDGELWSTLRGQSRVSLPAAVEGDFKRACQTAVLLYWMLPVFLGRR